MTDRMAELIREWAEGVNHYDMERCRAVEPELTLLLCEIDAGDRESGVEVDGWIYWTRPCGPKCLEVARERILDES
jgi:hypothetical protein